MIEDVTSPTECTVRTDNGRLVDGMCTSFCLETFSSFFSPGKDQLLFTTLFAWKKPAPFYYSFSLEKTSSFLLLNTSAARVFCLVLVAFLRILVMTPILLSPHHTGLRYDMLETIVPKTSDARVLVVSGSYAGQVCKF